MQDTILKKIDATPSTNIVDVISFSGYTIEAAIADILDNSISAGAKNIWIKYNFDGPNSSLSIIDDGRGMTENELHESLRYGYKDLNDVRDITDIGRYGIGLKSASSSFCKSLFVTSKKDGHPQTSIKMDFKYIKTSNKWDIFLCENRKDLLIVDKGTIVIWEGLQLEKDPLQNNNLLLNERSIYPILDKIEKHLSKVFYLYIKNHGVNIYLNKNRIEGWDPFFESHKSSQITYNDNYPVNGSTIKIVTHILPVYDHLTPEEKEYEFGFGKNLEELQGFYVYRNDRLISIGGWLDIEGLNISSKANYARIGLFVDNKLDKYLSVNFIKNSITLPVDLIEKLKPIAKAARSQSSKNYDYTKEPRPYKKKHEIIDNAWITTRTPNGLKAEVNKEHPIIKSICKDLSTSKRNMLFKLLSKTLPIAEFESFRGVDDYYTNDEILEMLEYKYNELKAANYNDNEIFAVFKKTQPFNDERYSIVLFEFMDGKKNE